MIVRQFVCLIVAGCTTLTSLQPTVSAEPELALVQSRVETVGQSSVADRNGSDKSKGTKQEIASKSLFGEDRFPTIDGGRLRLPPLAAPTTQISEIGNGKAPTDAAADAMTLIQPLPEGYDRPGNWERSEYHWQAANTFSHPLYFEDMMLERHGHKCKHCLQPIVSGARFFSTLPALPYLMTVQRPCDNYHSLGYYRPGTRAPNLLQRPPYQRDAAINQAAAIAGGVLLFP